MQIIIGDSSVLGTYTNFNIFTRLTDVPADFKNVNVIILTEVVEKDMDLGRILTDAKSSGVKRFIYINEEPLELISALVRGFGGIVENDESLLEEDTLEYIVENYEDYKNSNKLAVIESTSIIDDFIQGVVNNDSKVNSEYYQDRVKTALDEVIETSKKAETALTKISKSTLDLFKDVSVALHDIEKIKKKFDEKVYELESKLSETPIATDTSNSVYAYPSVKYVGVKTVLYIKEKSECKYLLSFLLAYQDYLENKMSKKVKIIVTYQKFIDTQARYRSATQINVDTANTDSLISNKFIATHQPKRNVMYRLFDTDNDIFIVLDRMWGTEILTGACIRTLYATSGVDAMRKSNILPNKCILSTANCDNLFMSIPTISNYPQDVSSRKAAYFQTCKELYNKLNVFLDIQ